MFPFLAFAVENPKRTVKTKQDLQTIKELKKHDISRKEEREKEGLVALHQWRKGDRKRGEGQEIVGNRRRLWIVAEEIDELLSLF